MNGIFLEATKSLTENPMTNFFDSFNWRPWIVGIWSAVIGGGFTSLSTGVALVGYDAWTGTPGDARALLIKCLIAFAVGALIHLATYLSTHPVPPDKNSKNGETT